MSNELVVPERCKDGHELMPRTTIIQTQATAGAAVMVLGYECVPCLRVACWNAHHPTTPIPADRLAPQRFIRARELSAGPTRLPAWTKRVHFQSGWQFADPDPTPAQLAERRLADERRRQLAERRLEAEREELELRRRRKEKRLAAEESTRHIRELMGVGA